MLTQFAKIFKESYEIRTGKTSAQGQATDIDFADFEPSLIKLNSFDGKLYGLPTFVQTPLVVYNKDVFAKDSFQPPKTWEETLAIAKKLKEKGTGIAVPAKGTADFRSPVCRTAT